VTNIVVLDYGSGNVRSAQRALETTGADVHVSKDFDEALNADGLLIPGVGAFAACVRALRSVRGDQIIERRLAGGRPVMGICVGMQILFDASTEHGTTDNGLAQWPGTLTELDAPVLPHMGWNTVLAPSESKMFDGIADERFYFVHSFAATTWELVPNDTFIPPTVTWSEYGQKFVAAVENGPLWATQFHPEKSGEAGLALLKNWVREVESTV
jgi:glutamine amidotransferase